MTSPETEAGEAILTVFELTKQIKELLQDNFAHVRVRGEISNTTHSSGGHWYFTLKDRDAELRCVCFRREAGLLKTLPKDGLEAIAQGRISVFAQQGQYQLYVEALAPEGQGSLQRKFDQLKEKLEAEGLFEESRKRPLPALPERIGIVTSPTGAAIADMLRVLERRFPGLHVRLYPAQVQGKAAAKEIEAGIRYFGEQPWADVVIAGRGGGSIEDLWAFNEERVARAIFESKVPVVSAVGHQTDFTIADFVADLRAATPSAAAEHAVPEARELVEAIQGKRHRASRALALLLEQFNRRVLETGLHKAANGIRGFLADAAQSVDCAIKRLRTAQHYRTKSAAQRLAVADRRLAAVEVRARLARRARTLDKAWMRLVPAMRSAIRTKTSRLDGAARLVPTMQADIRAKASRFHGAKGRLEALSPLKVLERGYAIVTAGSGAVVRKSSEVTAGDALDVRLHEGELEVTVEHARAPSAEPSEPDSRGV